MDTRRGCKHLLCCRYGCGYLRFNRKSTSFSNTPTPLEICDIDNDGFGEFTLTDKDIEIIGGEPGVVS